MADARSIILHEYPTSPYAEKIRLALRLKNLAYSRVEIPVIMPRPDLMPLTGAIAGHPSFRSALTFLRYRHHPA